MRFDEMQSIYPNILELFSEVQDMMHNGFGPEITARCAKRWIAKNIWDKQHRRAVSEKAAVFIAAVVEPQSKNEGGSFVGNLYVTKRSSVN